jgi:hypothetical protein
MHCTPDGSGDVHFQVIISHFSMALEKGFFACGKKFRRIKE